MEKSHVVILIGIVVIIFMIPVLFAVGAFGVLGLVWLKDEGRVMWLPAEGIFGIIGYLLFLLPLGLSCMTIGWLITQAAIMEAWMLSLVSMAYAFVAFIIVKIIEIFVD